MRRPTDPRPVYCLICLFLVLILFLFVHPYKVYAAYTPLTQQEGAAQIATQARQLGLPETDPIIKRAQEIWWQMEFTFRFDRDMIAVAIYHEAWGGCTDRHRELVGAVINNRTQNPKFRAPTIYEVLNSPGAYAKNFTNPSSKNWQEAQKDPAIWAHCQEIATKVLNGEVNCPPNVVFQANFIQGKIYEVHKTNYSTTYFCYGS